MALATFPPHLPSRCYEVATMADDAQGHNLSSGGDLSGIGGQDGNRAVILYDLQLFMAQIKAQFDELGRGLQDSNAKRRASDVLVKKNEEEILLLREHYHDISNKVQGLALLVTKQDMEWVRLTREQDEKRLATAEQLEVARQQKTFENIQYFVMVSVPTAVIVAIISILAARLLH